jgi:hypothetical protein
MFVCCECCVLSGRGLCDGLITRPEDSYRLCRFVMCDQETSNEEAKARYGAVKNITRRGVTPRKQTNKPSVYIVVFLLAQQPTYEIFRTSVNNINADYLTLLSEF